MPASATGKKVRISPRKVAEVAALVRGRTVADAIVILEHTPRRAAEEVKQVIKSARANAEHNHSYKPDSLTITHISVSPGPQYKRWRPAARGRALPFARRTSHIFVQVEGEKRQIKKPASAKTSPKEKE